MTAHSVAHARLRHALKRTAILAGLLCGLSLSHANAEFPEERLDFKLTENTDGLLRFVIETSIPTPFEAIVEISLAGQQPRDVYIGHLPRGCSSTARTASSSSTCAARECNCRRGTYQAKVAFYNAWGWRNGNKRARETPDTVIRKSVLLRASGIAPAAARSRAEKQRWIFLNVKPRTRWVPQFFTRNIGDFETLEDGELASFYFPDAQMTFLVSSASGQIVGWQYGKPAGQGDGP